MAASLPPWGYWPLAFVGLALWVELLTDTRPHRRALLSALVSVSWLGPATVWMVDLTMVGWPLAVAGFAAMHAAAGSLTPPDGRRRVAFPAAFVLAELLRWSWPFGGVPLATMAIGQVTGPLSPAVRIGGPLLLTALAATAGVALATILSTNIGPALISVAVVVVPTVAGSLAPATQIVDTAGNPDADARIVVAVVQGGGPQNTRSAICDQRGVFERHMETTRTEVEPPVDLVLWPEDVVHPRPDSEARRRDCPEPLLTSSEARLRLSELAQDLDSVLVVGFFEPSDDGEANLNHVTSYDSSGAVTDTYHKVQLVPFGEYVPLRSTAERFSSELPPRDVRAGPSDEPAALNTPLGSMGVVISWEVFFEHRARSATGDGEGRLLLNPTNGSSYWLTIVQSQQIASSRLRALETGRWVLQAAPTGFSAVIAPSGEVIKRTGISDSAVIQTQVELRSGDTLAVRLGVWPTALGAALMLLLALARGHLYAKRKPEGEQ